MNVWSHPGVALAFLRAVKWVAERVLSGEEPLKDPAWPLVRASAGRAAEFVRKHKGRLHWGAWKAHVGELGLREGEVRVYLGAGTEHDGEFLQDLRAMLARLEIPHVTVVPLRRSRGDYASNVLWHEESGFAAGFEPYEPGKDLALSWRFRNDPEFRRREAPKMEMAIARLLKSLEEDDGNSLVREVVPFTPEWPPEARTEEGEEGPWDGAGEVYGETYAVCSACGEEIPAGEAWLGLLGGIYCQVCYNQRYTRCAECDGKVERSEAEKRNGLHYCDACYASLFASSEEGEEAILRG